MWFAVASEPWLSSDQVVAQLFKDGQWEAAAAPLYFASQVGFVCGLQLQVGHENAFAVHTLTALR